jgi:hypothetical protein
MANRWWHDSFASRLEPTVIFDASLLHSLLSLRLAFTKPLRRLHSRRGQSMDCEQRSQSFSGSTQGLPAGSFTQWQGPSLVELLSYNLVPGGARHRLSMPDGRQFSVLSHRSTLVGILSDAIRVNEEAPYVGWTESRHQPTAMADVGNGEPFIQRDVSVREPPWATAGESALTGARDLPRARAQQHVPRSKTEEDGGDAFLPRQ